MTDETRPTSAATPLPSSSVGVSCQSLMQSQPLLTSLLHYTRLRARMRQHLGMFVEQMKSTDPLVYSHADPRYQLYFMKHCGFLPDAPRLQVLGGGQVYFDDLIASSTPPIRLPLSEQQLARGEVLEEVLRVLQRSDPTLQKIPGEEGETLAVRAGKLRETLGRYAGCFRRERIDALMQALARQVCRDVRSVLDACPHLSAPIAQRLVATLNPEQLRAFRSSGLLPQVQAEQARVCERFIREFCLYEDLQYGTPPALDSMRLGLRLLETLPGWEPGTRIELKQQLGGAPVDAIGIETAEPGRMLEVPVQEDRRDFYTLVWDALRPQERSRLHLSNPEQLRAAVEAAVLPETQMNSLLESPPVEDVTRELFESITLGRGRTNGRGAEPGQHTRNRVDGRINS